MQGVYFAWPRLAREADFTMGGLISAEGPCDSPWEESAVLQCEGSGEALCPLTAPCDPLTPQGLLYKIVPSYIYIYSPTYICVHIM